MCYDLTPIESHFENRCYSVTEYTLSLKDEMYDPASYAMVEFYFVTSMKHPSKIKKIKDFIDIINLHKLNSNGGFKVQIDTSEYGFLRYSPDSYKYSFTIEFNIYDLDVDFESLRKIFRFYKVRCTSLRPMIIFDINVSLLTPENFPTLTEILKIFQDF